MHSEYKVPGGKLVVADVDIVDGRFANVRISGDFFLDPDDALETITTAVEGMPADSSVDAIVAHIEHALPAGAALIGLSLDALARVLRGDPTPASRWRDHDWRLIDGPPQSELMHMALDEVLANEVAAGRRPPTVRFWQRTEPAVIIGSFQSVSNEVDMDAASRLGVHVARRITGGGAMFVEPGSFVTYSIYAPDRLVAGLSTVESYEFLDAWAVDALREMGLDARFQPINDIVSASGKIGGAAQKRFRSGVVLHHTTMSYDMDTTRMMQVLRIGREKLRDKGVTSAAKRVDPLRRHTGLERTEVIRRMQETFRTQHGATDDTLTGAELAAARRLVDEKFDTHAWLYRVP